MTLPNPPGRQVVAPGETIASEWGNAVWEQSANRFDSTADRDTQWDSPDDGALAYTAAERALWHRRGGVWLPLEASKSGTVVVDADANGGFVIPYGVTFPANPNVMVGLGDLGSAVGVPMPIPYVWAPGVTPSQFAGGVRDYLSNPLPGPVRIVWKASLGGEPW